ncbi:MAG TPA: hypothetical protein VF147_03765, partial [Vicinamibacterales bacterium]
AERDAQVTRAQVQGLLAASAARTRTRKRDGLLAVAALVAVFAGARAIDAQQSRPQPLTVRAPFTVVDDKNTPIVTISYAGKGSPRGVLAYSEEGAPTAQLTVTTTGDGMIALRRAGQNPFKGSVDENAVGLGIDDQGNGSIHLRNHSQTVVELGNDTAGNGMLRIADMAGKPIVKVQEKGADPRGLLVLNAQAQIVAQATADSTGAGSVKVLTPKGIAVGGLFASESGGGLALTGPSGGASAISLKVEPTGGKVRVFPAGGGSALAEITGESTGGAVTIYSPRGGPLGSMNAANGRGYFELNDAGGSKMVEASSQADGKGYVLVTPWTTSVSPGGDPSVLRGGKKK